MRGNCSSGGFQRIPFSPREMCVTQKGRLGMIGAECHTQVVDGVLVLGESATPCVMRENTGRILPV
jgi:hypothetical protein